MTNIRKIEKATGLIAAIKKLDDEIILIEKFAIQAAEEEQEFHFSISLKQEEQKRSDGFFRIMLRGYPLLDSDSELTGYEIKPEKEKLEKITAQFNTNTTLILLGTLLRIRQEERTVLLQQLDKIIS